jgi:hypothetical protein
MMPMHILSFTMNVRPPIISLSFIFFTSANRSRIRSANFWLYAITLLFFHIRFKTGKELLYACVGLSVSTGSATGPVAAAAVNVPDDRLLS